MKNNSNLVINNYSPAASHINFIFLNVTLVRIDMTTGIIMLFTGH